jgi:hypothetical protein
VLRCIGTARVGRQSNRFPRGTRAGRPRSCE